MTDGDDIVLACFLRGAAMIVPNCCLWRQVWLWWHSARGTCHPHVIITITYSHVCMYITHTHTGQSICAIFPLYRADLITLQATSSGTIHPFPLPPQHVFTIYNIKCACKSNNIWWLFVKPNRGRVVVEFGKPIVVTEDARLADYVSGDPKRKRDACNSLLEEVAEGLRGVLTYTHFPLPHNPLSIY